MVADFIDGSAEYTFDDLEGIEFDEEIRTIPVVSLAQYISAAAAEYNQLPTDFKNSDKVCSKMLN